MVSAEERQRERDRRLDRALEGVEKILEGAAPIVEAAGRIEVRIDKLEEVLYGEAGEGGLRREVRGLNTAIEAQRSAKKRWTSDFRWWLVIVGGVVGGLSTFVTGWAFWSFEAALERETVKQERRLDMIEYRLDNARPGQGIPEAPRKTH